MKKKKYLIIGLCFLLQIFSCKKEDPIVVEPIPTTPVVKIISPDLADLIGDSVKVEVSATDDKGIAKVEIYIDNKIPLGGSLFAAPYVYFLSVDSLADSSAHTIYAKAYDADDNVTSSTIKTFFSYKFTPSRLQAIFLGDTSVSISWKDNSRKEIGFEIERKINDNPYSLIKTVAANTETINIPGEYLANDSISFRIRAISAKEKSGYSNIAGGKLIFSSPSNLSIVKSTKDTVFLQWQDKSNFEIGFDIYQGTDTLSMQLVKSVSSNITTAVFAANINEALVYYFRVQAKSKFNQSNFSNTVLRHKTINNIVFVEGGTFQMGSNESVDNASPIHSVTLSGFYIKKTEVTQLEWRTVVDWKKNHGGTSLSSDPNQTKGDSLPVDRVNWNDVQLWLSHLNEKENTTKYRLPTEAEWEFAARGGNSSKGFIYSGSNNVDDVSWNYNNSGLITHLIGRKLANEIGIYDMSGNVWEWCSDWHGAYSNSAQTNPTGPASGTNRIVRGGSALHDTGSRVALRAQNPANITPSYTLGFRYILEK